MYIYVDKEKDKGSEYHQLIRVTKIGNFDVRSQVLI